MQDGKCWTLLTTLQELKGHEEPEFGGAARPKGVEHGTYEDRLTWSEQKAQDEATLGYDEQPYVVIVGGGQDMGTAHCLLHLAIPLEWRPFDLL